VRRLAFASWLLVPALAAATPRSVGIVDVRPLDAPRGARDAAEEVLRGRPDLTLVVEPALRASLVGVADLAKLPPAATGCEGLGDDALVAWLSAAPPDDVREPVVRLLGRQLLCADTAKDRGTALAAARRLTALGSDAGVPAEVWSRYPAVDATVDVLRQPLAVATDPGSAAVSVDFTPAGTAPIVATVNAGRRLVTGVLGERVAAAFVEVKENQARAFELRLPAVDERLAPVRSAVRALRRGGSDVAAVARAAGIEVVVLLRTDGVLAYALDGNALRPLGRAPLGDGAALLALLPAFAPPPAPETKRAGRSPWIYVIAGGAAAAAVGLVVLATSSGSATQRIELKWP